MNAKGDICTCISPVYVLKSEAAVIKKSREAMRVKTNRLERVQKKRELEAVRHGLECLICGGEAVLAGKTILCVNDTSHVFPCSTYNL
jgi:hypothetical protein